MRRSLERPSWRIVNTTGRWKESALAAAALRHHRSRSQRYQRFRRRRSGPWSDNPEIMAPLTEENAAARTERSLERLEKLIVLF